jgi:hypothetical protein
MLSTEMILLCISLMGNVFIILKRIRYISCFGEACIIDCRNTEMDLPDSNRSEQSVVQRAITKFKMNRTNKKTSPQIEPQSPV